MSSTNSPKSITKPSRGLGRGVDALFLNDVSPTPSANIGNSSPLNSPQDGVSLLSVNALVPGRYQPRQSFDDASAQELTESVRIHGVLQPIIVHHVSEKKHYEIIAGERRWRAAKAAGLLTIPALIKTVTDQQMMLFGLIENLQRENLNCLEEAEGIARIVNEHHITHEKTAELLSKSRSAITNSLRLLDLSDPVKDYLRQGFLEMGHARALLPLSAPQQKNLADLAVMHQLSVRDVEKRSKLMGKKQPSLSEKTNKKQLFDNDTQQFLNQIEEVFSLPVDLIVDNSGRGKLVFRFSKKEQQLMLLNRLIGSVYPQSSTDL